VLFERLAQTLNARLTSRSAQQALRVALDAPELGEIVLISSFGAEAVVLLHLVGVTKPDLPVVFLETGKHFTETLVYRHELTERLNLTNVGVVAPDTQALKTRDPKGNLHRQNPNACCALRKAEPLAAAMKTLPNLSAVITGRKRFQGGQRTSLDVFEANGATGLIKVNPLVHWTSQDLREYMDENRLPKHPLLAKGYLSIGCAPCTSPVAKGEDARAGRWRNSEKIECGIHFINGRTVRGPVQQKETI
jgi:phosphoadenosine phosphosulfate reductase